MCWRDGIFADVQLATYDKERITAGVRLNKIVRAIFLLFFCLSSATLTFADHFESQYVARGKSEHVLSEIDVYKGDIHQIIARLGKPDKFEDKEGSDYPKGSGERSYFWKWHGTTLRVGTEYYTDPPSHKIIESPPIFVDIWGHSATGGFSATGAGLSLGATIDSLKKIYGTRFLHGKNAATLREYVTLQWNDETELDVDFDSKGRVCHMQLAASIE